MKGKQWKARFLSAAVALGAAMGGAGGNAAAEERERKAVANIGEVTVYEEMDSNARAVGLLPMGGFCQILEDEEEFWHYVESGNVRGFVRGGELLLGEAAEKCVEEQGEENLPLAEVLVEPEENAAWDFLETQENAVMDPEEQRKALADYALQFVGNPYVWGGTSLTDGADCSGFTQSVYAAFGYAIPRTAQEQALCGTQVSVGEALPGDLIFYLRDGAVYHVAVYVGDGQTVQAADRKQGICVSGMGSEALRATRLIQ